MLLSVDARDKIAAIQDAQKLVQLSADFIPVRLGALQASQPRRVASKDTNSAKTGRSQTTPHPQTEIA
jgi:hypothetical protein